MSETLVNPDKREEAASAPAEAAARVNLLDFDAAGLKAWCESIGEKPFSCPAAYALGASSSCLRL